MWLSVLPLVLGVGLAVAFGYLVWDIAVDQVRWWLESFPYVSRVWEWLDSVGVGRLKGVLAQLIVVLAATPFLLLVSLLAVAQMMTPALVRMVAQRRFPNLQAAQGPSWIASVLWALGSCALALLALVVSIPLWVIPPLWLILPPLILGWLTYRVMVFDALAAHASATERSLIFRKHRGALLVMGVVCGSLSAAPSLVWTVGTGFAAAFVLLAPVAIWIYTLVFAFSSLWFIHYCLAALQQLRAQVPDVPRLATEL
jgi:hypothetical protein